MIHLLTNTYAVIDPWFGRCPQPIELDMGCGKGRFALDLAAYYPDRLILGSDVMLGRLRRVARKVERRGLENVELLRAESIELVGYQLPDCSVRRLHLLCPDPWPKARHRHQRLITTDFLTRVARVLEPDGVLHIATDHTPYLLATKALLDALPFFAAAPDRLDDLRDLKTDFELTWEQRGKTVPHLAYRRVMGPCAHGGG